MSIPALFGKDDSICWTYVRQHVHSPWFYCMFSEKCEDGGEKNNMIFLCHPAQLAELFEMDGVVEVLDIQVVLPSHMTKEERWVMRPLASIWEGEVDGYTELVYVTSDGQRFSTSREIADESQLTDKRLLYPPSH